MNHYSMIGFPVEVGDSDWAQRTVLDGDELDGGLYYVLRSESGAELWVAGARKTVMAFDPHFASDARCPLLLLGRLNESRYECSFEAVGVCATPQDPEGPERFGPGRDAMAREQLLRVLEATRGAQGRSARMLGRLRREPAQLNELRDWESDDMMPLEVVFDAPDARLQKDLKLPTVADVQLAAFAQDCSWYASEAEFFAWLESEDIVPFRDAFIMHRHIDPSPEMGAVASISGTVLETAEQVNELTGLSFRWARVGVGVGELDLVADPAIEGGEPVVGGVVYGRVWLSGRILAGDAPH
jgi:hypothetical protein